MLIFQPWGLSVNKCRSIKIDRVTICGGQAVEWNDAGSAYQPGGGYGQRNAASTTINAACLEGIVQSTNDARGNPHYSGGLENFLRLEEDWSGDTLTYNGSIVVMFPSRYATNYWQTPGHYYNVPTRHWAFDLNFTNPDKLPANTPEFFAVDRIRWAAR